MNKDVTNLANSLGLVFRARPPNQSTAKLVKSRFGKCARLNRRNGQNQEKQMRKLKSITAAQMFSNSMYISYTKDIRSANIGKDRL